MCKHIGTRSFVAYHEMTQEDFNDLDEDSVKPAQAATTSPASIYYIISSAALSSLQSLFVAWYHLSSTRKWHANTFLTNEISTNYRKTSILTEKPWGRRTIASFNPFIVSS